MKIVPIRTRLFLPKESLADFVVGHLPRPKEGSVIVVTSKILALAQGRVVDAYAKEKWIKKESTLAVRTPWCWLTLKDGEWCANAGVDESNANGQLILLPKKITQATIALLTELKKRFRRKRLGVIVTDTRIYPLRAGTMGVAVAYAGFSPLTSYIGRRDLFGRRLKFTQANVVNALAVASVLVMGEGAEQQPLALIEDAPVTFVRNAPSLRSLTIDPCDDLYRAAYAIRRQKFSVRSTRRRR